MPHLDFNQRKEEITKQLVDAAENSGFLMLVDHGISIDEINQQFAISKAFFQLPHEIKGKTAYDINQGLGWEYKVSGIIRGSLCSHKKVGPNQTSHWDRSKRVTVAKIWLTVAE